MSATTRTAGVEQPGQDINQLALWDDLPECDDCGHAFYPDSSPNAYLCWECDAARAEAAGTGWFR